MNTNQIFLAAILLLNSMNSFAQLEKYTIRGELINHTPEQIADIQIVAHKVLPSGQQSENVFISEAGKFQITGQNYLDLSQIWLSVEDLYHGELLVSKELNVTLDIGKLSDHEVKFYGDGIEFEGKDADATLFANQWILFEREAQLKLDRRIQANFAPDPPIKEKEDTLSQIFQELKLLRSTFLQNQPKRLAWIVDDKISSNYFSQRFLMSLVYDTDWEFYVEALKHKPRVFGNSGFLFYLYQSYFLKESEIGKNVSELDSILQINLKKIDPINSDYVVLSAIPDDLKFRIKYLETFLPLINQPWAREYMTHSLNSSQTQVAEINKQLSETQDFDGKDDIGKPHKKFSFGAQTYVSEETDDLAFLRSIQSRFEGQAIIVDIWSTWCAPCIKDMKQSREVKKELADAPVEIVYLCTEQGGSIEKWQQRIAETECTGTHIFINNKLTTALMERFELAGYPSYLFFDKDRKYRKGLFQRITGIDVGQLEELLVED